MSMCRYELRNKNTGETRVVKGVNFPNACNVNGLDIDEWDVIKQTFIDKDENPTTPTYDLDA